MYWFWKVQFVEQTLETQTSFWNWLLCLKNIYLDQYYKFLDYSNKFVQ